MKELWKRFWSNPYRWGLWHWIGGRPWTYIMRDFYQKFEFFIIMGFFSLGYFIHPYLTLREFIILAVSGTIFFILGHVLWGTKHIPGQGKKPFENEIDKGMSDG